jgi:NADH-quinone oxidoreductase subunit N
MPMPTSFHLLVLLPTIILTVGACVLLLSEVFLTRKERGYQAWVAGGSALLAFFAALALVDGASPAGPILKGAVRGDAFQAFIGATVCAGLFLSILVSAGFLRRLESERGEYYALLLFAGAGMLLLAMSNDLVMIFIALETMSVATYALAAYLRRGARPTEAAFKYFILGAFSSALYLYGAALAYGATGSTGLSEIAVALGQARGSRLLAPAIGLLTVGFAFKVAAVPFHMWAPDVYEGSPTPVTAFMAVGVKAAAFAAFFRVIAVAFGSSPEKWGPIVTALAMLTMLVGNLVALPQRNVKRMLAYSSIAHAGYILVALASSAGASAAARTAAGQGILFYLAAYTVSAVGAFGIASVLERKDSDSATAWDLDRFAGLGRRRPVLALFMAVFMLSLAGIPTTAGFMGKLLIFRAALDAGQIGLAIFGIITSAMGAYYYLRVVVTMYFRNPVAEAAPEGEAAGVDWGVAIACALVFVLGLGPSSIAEAARRGAQILVG